MTITAPTISYTTEQLLEAIIVDLNEELRRGKSSVPLAAICKRLQVRMSVLQRHFTVLQSLGFAEANCDATGRWSGHLLVNPISFGMESGNDIISDTATKVA